MEEQRVLKQTYLREAILEAGYSPEKFIEYLESVKKGSVDIDKWTLEELKEEVTNYKRYYSVDETSKSETDANLDSGSNERSDSSPIQRNNSTKFKEKSLSHFRIGPSRSKTTTGLVKKEEEAKTLKGPSDTVITKQPKIDKNEKLHATIKE